MLLIYFWKTRIIFRNGQRRNSQTMKRSLYLNYSKNYASYPKFLMFSALPVHTTFRRVGRWNDTTRPWQSYSVATCMVISRTGMSTRLHPRTTTTVRCMLHFINTRPIDFVFIRRISDFTLHYTLSPRKLLVIAKTWAEFLATVKHHWSVFELPKSALNSAIYRRSTAVFANFEKWQGLAAMC